MELNLKSLIGKLNTTCRIALEGAAGLCLSRTNYDVEVEHVFARLLEPKDTDLTRILKYYEVDPSRLVADLTRAIDRLKTGNARTPALSPRVGRLIEDAWLLASVEYGTSKVRSGHLMLAALASGDLARLTREISSQFKAISAETLKANLLDITAGSSEAKEETRSIPVQTAGEPSLMPAGKTKALEQFTIDLTARARAGHIDPVLGRDFEIRQVVDILTRRRQNNPILTGEAGVGKTAVVEGFALRIVEGDVPPPLRNVTVCTLDLGLLQAGAGIKGEFENRLKSVIEEVKSSPNPIILFIDEAHTMIGAGGQAGQSDAANLLKPALARGELRTIAATTWAEYKKYFEKDAALSRRFQVVKVDEPTEDQAVIMMRGLSERLENHHKVRILDQAVVDAVRLSNRYISGRQLPDKSVSVLDTACARVAIGLAATPPAIEDAERRISQLDTESAALGREAATGSDHQERLDQIDKLKLAEEEKLVALKERWTAEKDIVSRIIEIRSRLEEHGAAVAGDGIVQDGVVREDGIARALAAQAGRTHSESSVLPPVEVPVEDNADASAQRSATTSGATSSAAPTSAAPIDLEALRNELSSLNARLEELQGETPLVQACVTSQTIAEVVSGWTGIPVGRMLTDEINTVLSLSERLGQRVIGQQQALDAITRRIRTSRANLTDPRRPVGVFLLVGPSGVGKTETALALAEAMYGGERNLITINMSEYQEAHTVSSLKGSPPGYVGYGEGGVLTEAVRRKPYSVVLLDEAEKAHPDVMELFYQVFDKGMLEDGEGREIDFKHTIILLTSNTGTERIMKLCDDPETAPEGEKLVETLRPDLLKVFKPALLGRMVTVPYFPITDDVMRDIVRLQLSRIERRMADNQRAQFGYDEAVVTEIAARCKEVETGARNVDHILTRALLPEISGEVLSRLAAGERVSRVHISIGDHGQFNYEIS